YPVRATDRVRRKDYLGALEDYNRALALKPDAADLRARRGLVYLLNDAPRLARADFDEALRRENDNAEAYTGRALARVKLGQYRDGTADAEQAVRLAPKEWRTRYNAVRAYAQAALAVRAARGGPEVDNARSYEDRAMELLRQAV